MKEQIKELALRTGFKLKEQPDGSMDLNPYVYEFAHALIEQTTINVRKNIADVLEMTVEEALEFFSNIPKINDAPVPQIQGNMEASEQKNPT